MFALTVIIRFVRVGIQRRAHTFLLHLAALVRFTVFSCSVPGCETGGWAGEEWGAGERWHRVRGGSYGGNLMGQLMKLRG